MHHDMIHNKSRNNAMHRFNLTWAEHRSSRVERKNQPKPTTYQRVRLGRVQSFFAVEPDPTQPGLDRVWLGGLSHFFYLVSRSLKQLIFIFLVHIFMKQKTIQRTRWKDKEDQRTIHETKNKMEG